MKPFALLAKRIPRDIVHNLGKYIGIFVLLALSISFCTGYFVAANNIASIVDAMHKGYLVEDAEITASFPLTDKALDALEGLDEGVSLYEKFSFDVKTYKAQDSGETDIGTIRLFADRTDFDLASYFEGRAPSADDEIALDRLYAKNNDLSVGDAVILEGDHKTIVGLMALSDYAALMENNTDLIMNALTFGVALITPDAFDEFASYTDSPETYAYALRFADQTLSQADRITLEGDIVSVLADAGTRVNDLIDWENNKGITYAAEDIEGDTSIWLTLAVILIAIIGFVFVVITSATIEAESSVIGTLMASGYSARELTLHYAITPLIVGVFACVVGNILGYLVFVDVMAGLYYNSYSLPPLTVTFNFQALITTTVIPLGILVLVSVFGIARKLKHRPLQFLRHDLSKTKNRLGRIVFPQRLPYMLRLRSRIWLSNLSNFAVLFFGIFFASFLMLFMFSILPSVDHYAQSKLTDMPATYLYILKAPLEIDTTQEMRDIQEAAETLSALREEDLSSYATSDPSAFAELAGKAAQYDADAHPVDTEANSKEAISQAEKFATYSLKAPRSAADSDETVTVYGIAQDSAYWHDIQISDGAIVAGAGLAQKCGVSSGEDYTFSDPLQDANHTFYISDVCGSVSNTDLYMSLDTFNEIFDNASDYFNGYASDETLNIDSRYLMTVVTEADIQKTVDQFQASMGNMMYLLIILGIVIYFVLMFLLTKTIVDRAARIISYFKVFGYTDSAVNRIYLVVLSLMVVVCLVISIPISMAFLNGIFVSMMAEYNGNFEFFTTAGAIAQVLLMGCGAYIIVALIQMQRIRAVPLSLALKIAE